VAAEQHHSTTRENRSDLSSFASSKWPCKLRRNCKLPIQLGPVCHPPHRTATTMSSWMTGGGAQRKRARQAGASGAAFAGELFLLRL